MQQALLRAPRDVEVWQSVMGGGGGQTNDRSDKNLYKVQ
jgi:hypothetical protein